MALSDAAQTSTWLVPPMLILTVQPAWQTQQDSKCQNRRIFIPTRISWGEKARPGLWSQHPPSCSSSPAAAPALPGEISPSNLTPGIVLYPANKKQPNAIQPVPTSSCFQQKSPKNRPGAVQPQPGCRGADGSQPATCGPHGRLPPASPPRRPQPGNAAPGSRQRPGSRWNKGAEKAKPAASAGGRFPPDSQGSHVDSVRGACRLLFHQLPCDFALGIF